MLYVHSSSPIEQQILELLDSECVHHQLEIGNITNLEYLEKSGIGIQNHTLLYSFQKFENYKHLDTFQAEINHLKVLVEFIVNHSFKKIILISYPGAYPFSDNLFLQHKGIIEQMFVESKIPTTIFKVQGICNPPMHMNNFHQLFYHYKSHQYIIPRESRNVVYATNILNLVSIILRSEALRGGESFDVFDQVFSLKSFLHKNSNQIEIKSRPAIYLYFLSILDRFCSPNMFELFIRPGVPMYNFRTEKVFNLGLHSDLFEQLKSDENRNLQNEFIFSKKGKLIPVT